MVLACGVAGLAATLAEAGLYHTGGKGTCLDCHKKATTNHRLVALASLSNRPSRPKVSSGVGEIRSCLECHDGRAGNGMAPGVLEASRTAVVRAAGFLNGPGGVGHCGHTLGSMQQAPGGLWQPGPEGLTCTDCHDPHADGEQYRNLVLRPGTAAEDRRVTFVAGPTNDPGKDVWVRSGLEGTEKYDARTIYFNQPLPGQSAYAAWCQGCHAAFHGSLGSVTARGMNGWKRHPTAEARIGGSPRQQTSLDRYAKLANRVPTLSPSASWPGPDNSVSCMSCHKAHGNGNPFGLLFMAGGGTLTENGDSQGAVYMDLCHQCHTQGLAARF